MTLFITHSVCFFKAYLRSPNFFYCSLLHQMHLTDEELEGVFNNSCTLCVNSTSNVDNSQSVSVPPAPKKTLRARLMATSTRKPSGYLDGLPTLLTEPMSLRPCQPEPQNDPYWLAQREGQIRTCHGCLNKTLGKDIIGRIELDYSKRVDTEKGVKYWKLSTKANYYHPNINCLRDRRPALALSMGDVRVDEGAVMTASIVNNLGL